MQELILKRKTNAPVWTDNFGAEHPDLYVKVVSVINNQQNKTLQITWSVWHDEDACINDRTPIFTGSYNWYKDARVENDIPYSSYDDVFNAISITTTTKLATPAIQWVLNYQIDPCDPSKKWGEYWEILE